MAAANYPPTDLPEIKLPWPVAAARYGTAIAALMGRKATSRAMDAIDQPADKFNWVLAYKMADDPATADEAEFLAGLKAGTSVWLICRGFKWKGWEELPDIPPQIMVRLEERARLICGQRAAAPELSIVSPEAEPTGPTDYLNRWVAANPTADRRLALVAYHAVKQLEETVQ